MKTFFTILLLGCMFQAFPQQQKTYFDSEIGKHIKAYRIKSERAIRSGNRAQSKLLFDSIFKNYLQFSYIRDFSLKKVKGGTLKTGSIDKPFLLITKSSWEIIKDEEIKEVNRMSKMYKGQLKIVILFWDSKKRAKAHSKNYNSNVTVTYIDERENDADHIIKTFKHSFGAPACFFISDDKQLLKIDRKFTISNTQKKSDAGFSAIHKKIKWMLFSSHKTDNDRGSLTKIE